MKKLMIIVVSILAWTTIGNAQIGLGAGAGMLNPGLH